MAEKKQFHEYPVAIKAFLAVFLVFALSVLSQLILFSGIQGEIDAAEADRRKVETDLSAAHARHSEYVKLKKKLAEGAGNDRKNRRFLPEKAELASFLQDLNRRAEVNGLKITSVQPRPEEMESMYVRLPVDLKVSGSYHQIAKFFLDVSELDRAINMENVQLSVSNGVGESVTLLMDVRATTFRSKTKRDTEEQKNAQKGPRRSMAPRRAHPRRLVASSGVWPRHEGGKALFDVGRQAIAYAGRYADVAASFSGRGGNAWGRGGENLAEQHATAWNTAELSIAAWRSVR